ncbi:MAG: YopX family protein [Alistipes putredinis]|jgi:hypothetical protein
MREIRYRGIGIAERKWVFGSLWFDTRDGVTLIWSEELKYWVRVDPATVGQYTGLKDEHGKEIYEGDIVLHFSNKYAEDEYAFLVNTAGIDPKHLHYYVVSWNNTEGGFGYVLLKELHTNNPDMCGFNPCLGFLVGNIHDNPELIEKQTAERHKTN